METGKTRGSQNDFVPRSEFEAFKKSVQDRSLDFAKQSQRYKEAYSRTTDERLPEKILDIFWNEIFYLNSFDTISQTTTAAISISITGRESDTTAGKFFLPTRKSRFKLRFYLLSGQIHSTVYIASPGISTTAVTATVNTAMIDNYKSFVGIKIVEGKVFLVSYNHNDGNEILIPTTFTITTDETHVLEINYFVTYAMITLDGIQLGRIDCKLNDDARFEAFFPFITSVGSNDGSSVNMTMEGLEFAQNR